MMEAFAWLMVVSSFIVRVGLWIAGFLVVPFRQGMTGHEYSSIWSFGLLVSILLGVGRALDMPKTAGRFIENFLFCSLLSMLQFAFAGSLSYWIGRAFS